MKMAQLTPRPAAALASPGPGLSPTPPLQVVESTETDQVVTASPDAASSNGLSHEKEPKEELRYPNDDDETEGEWEEEELPPPCQLPPPEEVLKTALLNVTNGLLNAFGY